MAGSGMFLVHKLISCLFPATLQHLRNTCKSKAEFQERKRVAGHKIWAKFQAWSNALVHNSLNRFLDCFG